MANLSSLTPITTTATALSSIVLVTPQQVVGYQPQNGFTNNSSSAQLYTNPALLFHYEGEQNVNLESDITDHYIEDNTAIQDQITQRPETITTHGFIGELNDVAPIGSQFIQSLQSKLTVIGSYSPQLTIDALIAYNEAFQAYQIVANAVTSAVSSWATISSGFSNGENVIGNNGLVNPVTGPASSFAFNLTQNRQQLAFQQFYGYWSSRTLFTVQTPWAVFQNMAIQRLRAIQDAETNMITDFEITFKRIRLAKLITIGSTSQSIKDSPADAQSATPIQNSSSPSVAPVSFDGAILGSFA